MQAKSVETEAVRQSDELKTVLLRAVSHDLRTPLTSIIAGGSALGSETLTREERVELSGGIVGEGKRLSRLVENLLDISRLEAGKAEPHRAPVDLADVLEAARVGQAEWESIRLSLDAHLPMVEADAAQLERAFANLMENAVRYGNGRPVLFVRAWSAAISSCAWSIRGRAYPRAIASEVGPCPDPHAQRGASGEQSLSRGSRIRIACRLSPETQLMTKRSLPSGGLNKLSLKSELF